MPRAVLIALIGVDGSGKTTQAKELAGWLRAGGHRARYFENAGGRPIWTALAQRRGHADGIGWLGARRYVVLESTVRWVALTRAVAWARLARGIAVLDRYSYCQYALMRARGDAGEQAVRRRYRFFPRPDLVCLLTVDATTAARRVDERGRDHEEPAYLAAFEAAYRSLPEASTFTVIDAGADRDQVGKELRAVVSALLERRSGRSG